MARGDSVVPFKGEIKKKFKIIFGKVAEVRKQRGSASKYREMGNSAGRVKQGIGYCFGGK